MVPLSEKKMALEVKVKQNTEQWLAARKGQLRVAIGGSGIGAAAGLNQHMSRSAYYQSQINQEKVEENEAMRHGHLFEQKNADLYARWTNNRVRECGVHFPDPSVNSLFQEMDDRYFCVSLDRAGEVVDLECKCPFSENSFRQYYEERIDFSYLAQVHLQMAVRGRERIHFMVTLYDPRTSRLKKAVLYEIYFSREFWRFIYERARPVAENLFIHFYDHGNTDDLTIADLDTEMDDIPAVRYRALKKFP